MLARIASLWCVCEQFDDRDRAGYSHQSMHHHQYLWQSMLALEHMIQFSSSSIDLQTIKSALIVVISPPSSSNAGARTGRFFTLNGTTPIALERKLMLLEAMVLMIYDSIDRFFILFDDPIANVCQHEIRLRYWLRCVKIVDYSQ